MKRRYNFKNLVGKSFGRLVVTDEAPRGNWGKIRWRCKCVCGKTLSVLADSLKRSATISCGCLGRERRKAATTFHGHNKHYTQSRTYSSWRAMLTRCTNPNHKEFSVYGGAGVRVLSGWQEFKNFVEDLGTRPEGTTLGRILDMGNYELGNAYWQTRHEQALARKNHRALMNWRPL